MKKLCLFLALVLLVNILPVNLAMAATLSITQQPKNVVVASGETAKVSVTATGDGLSYRWYYAEKGSSIFSATSVTTSSYSLTMNSTRSGRRVYCVITDKYGSNVMSNTVTMTMGTALKITKQPANATVASGDTAKVSVTATGDGLSYRWYYAEKGSSTFSATSVTTSSYSLTMNSTRSGRRVYCVVTDKYGRKVTSNTVTLSMATPLAITKQPANVTVASGATAKVSVTATGDGLSYLWYYADKGVSTFSASSVTASSYSLTMSSARSGRRVYCVITDKYGKKVTSNTVTLSMATPLAITKQPVNVTVASGATAKVSVTATGDGLSYLWYYADKGVSNFSASSVTTSSYSLTMSSARSGRRVYCVITDKYGKKVTSNTVTLSMATPLAITKQPTNVTVASGATAKVSVTATGDGLSYRWYYADKGVSTFSASSVTTSSYSLAMSSARSGRRVYCVITDKYGKKVSSNTVTLSMATPLAITKQPANVTVASGATAKVSVTATGDGLSYRWYYAEKGSSTFSASSVTTSSYSLAMSSARSGRRVYCVITDKYGKKVTSNTVTLSMATPLKITRQPVDVAVASGEVATVSVTATGDGLSYRWYYAEKGSSTFSATSIAASSYSMAMSEARDGRRVYCLVTDKYGNTVTSDKATLSILESDFVPVTKVKLNIMTPEEEYWVGDSSYGQLAKVYPDDATDTRVVLSCSDPSVVRLSVDKYGHGSAEMIGVGTAIITATAVSPTTEGGNTYAVDSCTITVIDPEATETIVDGSFNYSSATVTIGDKYYLKGTAEVSGSTLAKVTVNVLSYDVADYPAAEVSKTFSGSTSSISLGSYSSTYVFDTSKAPFNTPGTYTLNLWVKAADGTVEKVDTMKLTTEAAEEEPLPTLQALIGSTEYKDGSTYGPLANGGSDVLNLKAKVSNARRVYLAIFDASGTQIDFIDDANGTECKYLEYAYSSLTTKTQNLYARIKAGTVPGNYTVKISVSDSSTPNDPNANKVTLSFTLKIVAESSFATGDITSRVLNLLPTNYRPGNYFTTTGGECTNHTISSGGTCLGSGTGRCPIVNGVAVDMLGWQCVAFVRLCQYVYYDEIEKTSSGLNSHFSKVTVYDTKWSEYSTDAATKELFGQIGTGAHIRVYNSSNQSGSTGGHSLFITAISDTGVTLLEDNYSTRCKIEKKTCTWSQFRTRYPYGICYYIKHK